MDEGQFRFLPFDPASGPIPEIAEFELLAERSESGGIILIAVPDPEDPDWCARAAAALATTWTAQGARVLLADVSLTQPALHELFDLPNSEGIADVMIGGAQLRTVGRTVGSPEFPFIAAGRPPGDVADVMRSSRWDVVFRALGEADVYMVMYAPADLPGLDALLARRPAVLLLAGDPGAAVEAIRPLGLRESVGLEPPTAPEAPTGGTASPEKARKGSYLRSLRSVPPWKMAGALGLFLLLLWAGWKSRHGEATGSSEVSEELAESPIRERAAESLIREEPAESSVPAVAPPPETLQAYSLSMAAFQDGPVAAREAEVLAGRRADVLFTTVPVLVSGRVFHRVLAGPAADSEAAEELRTSLGQSLSGEDATAWIVRATPLAFALGDYESRDGAERRAREMASPSIGPYVFEIGAADRPSFRVYAGAFADSAEASVARAHFMEAGGEMPKLERRVGRYVARP